MLPFTGPGYAALGIVNCLLHLFAFLVACGHFCFDDGPYSAAGEAPFYIVLCWAILQ